MNWLLYILKTQERRSVIDVVYDLVLISDSLLNGPVILALSLFLYLLLLGRKLFNCLPFVCSY